MNKFFILVFNDVKNKSHINNVVPMNVQHSYKGSILIVTIYYLKVVKDYLSNISKFDIE